MLALKQDYTVNFMDYGKITIPKGTRTTHQTACGIDLSYNFVSDLARVKQNYKTISGILTHDLTYHGIDIPEEFLEKVGF